MNCPYCTSTATKQLSKKTSLDCRILRCESRANEPSTNVRGTPFNYLEYPTDIVLLVVLWRLRYTLSLRDLAEMFLKRCFVLTHEAVRDWEVRFARLMAEQRRIKRRGQAGESWMFDETYVKVHGN
jgi:putative transposase